MDSHRAQWRNRIGGAALPCLLAALGVVRAEPVGDLGAADRLVVRGLEVISAESLRAGLLADADLYWQGIPSADRDAYLEALELRATFALQAAGFPEPRVAVALEPGADGPETIVVDAVEGRRHLAGPIRVTGLPDDLAARLARFLQEKQPPRAARLETIPLPDGTTTRQWLDDDGAPARFYEPDWVPGKPAPFGRPSHTSLCASIHEFFLREGYFDLAGADDPLDDGFLDVLRDHVDVAVRPEGELAALAIHVKRLPPRSILTAIEIAGGPKTTAEELQAYLGLEVGQPITEMDRDLWLEKLRQSGRFVSQQVTFPPQADGVVACFELVEYRHDTPLSAPASPEEQALRRARDWLLAEWHAGRQIRLVVTGVDGTDEEKPPVTREFVLGRETGGAVTVTAGDARCGAAIVQDAVGFFAPTARLEGTLPGRFRPFLRVLFGVDEEWNDADATGHHPILSVTGGIGPRAISCLRIEPVWCTAYAHGATSRREGDVLVVECPPARAENGPAIVRLDAATGRVLQIELHGAEVRTTIRIETGDDLVTKALADLRAGSGENLADPARPLVSAARFLAAACDADPTAARCLDALVDRGHRVACAQACGKAGDHIRQFLDAGTLDPLDAVVADLLRDPSPSDAVEPLSIPNDPRRVVDILRPGLVSIMGHGFTPPVLRRLERSIGRDAVIVAVARAAVLRFAIGDAAAAARELDRLSPTPDIDPWTTAAADLLAAIARGSAEDGAPAGLAVATLARLDVIADAVDDALGRHDALALAARSWIAKLELTAGSPAAALTHARQVLATADGTVGPHSKVALEACLWSAWALKSLDRDAEALPLWQRIAEAGDESGLEAGTITKACVAVGLMQAGGEQYAAAIPLLEKGLERLDAGQGDAGVGEALLRDVLAYCQGRTGDLEKSLANYRVLLAEAERAHGPDHPETAKFLLNVIWLLNQTGDTAEAYALHRRPRAAIENQFGGGGGGLQLPMPARFQHAKPDPNAKPAWQWPEPAETAAAQPEADAEPEIERWSGLQLPGMDLHRR